MGANLTPFDRIGTADAVALGRIVDVQPSEDDPRVGSATLMVAAWLKGDEARRSLPIRLYTNATADGMMALWPLKKRAGREVLSETYPWLRIGPEAWLELPEPTRSQLFEALDHAASEAHDGLRLHLMRLPSQPGQPLQLALLFENASADLLQVPFDDPDHPGEVAFEVTDPEGRRTTVPLLRSEDVRALRAAEDGPPPGVSRDVARGKSSILAYRPGTPGPLSTQITLIEEPKAGEYGIRAHVAIGARAPDDEAPEIRIWSGELTVALATTVAAP